MPAVALAPLLAHECPCRGKVTDEFTDTDGARVVEWACGTQAVSTQHGWEVDPTSAPRTNPERTDQ